MLSSIALAPGRYELRIGLRNTAIGENGSVYADVEVPDFSKAPLSLAGITLSADTAGKTIPPALQHVLAAAPTTARQFGSQDCISLHARVYENAKPSASVTITTMILDGQGRAVAEHAETLATDRLSGTPRGAALDQPLALTALSSGAYLLVLSASADGIAPAERRVPFTIR